MLSCSRAWPPLSRTTTLAPRLCSSHHLFRSSFHLYSSWHSTTHTRTCCTAQTYARPSRPPWSTSLAGCRQSRVSTTLSPLPPSYPHPGTTPWLDLRHVLWFIQQQQQPVCLRPAQPRTIGVPQSTAPPSHEKLTLYHSVRHRLSVLNLASRTHDASVQAVLSHSLATSQEGCTVRDSS